MGAALVCGGIGVLTAASLALGAHSASRAAPARLLVSGKEYSLTLSRSAIERGPAVIQFLNRGQDPHDLRLRRIGRTRGYAASAPETRPGRLVELEARLSPGRYRLWCSLPGHRKLGMRAVLTVRHGRR
jgi:hypothetical protein